LRGGDWIGFKRDEVLEMFCPPERVVAGVPQDHPRV
jgi:hypothetical protein